MFDYPDRDLSRVTTLFRGFMLVPIAMLIGSMHGVGLLFFPVLLMLVFRGKYPRWWFDWNLELQRFSSLALAPAHRDVSQPDFHGDLVMGIGRLARR